MKQSSTRTIALLVASLAFLFATGCQSKPPPEPTVDVSAYKTVAVWVQSKNANYRGNGALDSAMAGALKQALQNKGYTVLNRTDEITSSLEIEEAMAKIGVTKGTKEGEARGAQGLFVATLNSIDVSNTRISVHVSVELVTIPERVSLLTRSGTSWRALSLIPSAIRELFIKSPTEIAEKAVANAAKDIPKQRSK